MRTVIAGIKPGSLPVERNRSRVLILSLLVSFILLVFPASLRSQNTPDQLKSIRSTVIDSIDGKVFYIHTIKRGQTLYMISRAYGVDVNDIISENPGVKEGIKADQKLRVPCPAKKTPDPGPLPAAKEKPPPKPLPPEKEKPAPPETPELTETKPLPDTVKKVIVTPDTVRTVDVTCVDDTSGKRVFQIALMLPLYLDEMPGKTEQKTQEGSSSTPKSFRFLTFYEGFRMAADSLEKLGLKARILVYDVDKDTAKTSILLSKPELRGTDLIIGLLYHRNFQMVAEFAKQNHINIVNPVSERSDLVTGNPWIFKVRPARKGMNGEVAGYMAEKFRNGQVIIIRNGKYADRDAPDHLKAACESKNLHVLLVEGQENAIPRLSKERDNYIVAFSDHAPYILDITRRFYELRKEYTITLFGLPDWNSLEGLETEYLISLKTHMISPNFIDYQRSDVMKFVTHFQDKYKTDPDLLAFLGFDVAYYFLSALKRWGPAFGDCLGKLEIQPLHMDFWFTKTEGNGYENQRWEIYRYENYRLVKD